ncbi:YdeI/OmpD-associated family protein [Daejeonella sp.]|uniref:YdeI/OmpD-associated family protein n=1 Tax=Daejeonella sp. TaxID=2805397 RepID=UPI0030C60BA8
MKTICFNAVLEPLDEKMVHHLIVVPEEIAVQFTEGKGAPRILCSIEGSAEFPCALNPRHGRHVIIASKQLIKKNKLAIDIPFNVSIRVDPHNGLGLPEELSEVLDQDPVALRAYDALNDGHKRGLIYYINQAKSIDSRIKRSLEIMEKMKERGNWS